MRPTALVTGAARRVGRAIALCLADHGYDVLIHYRNSREEALRTAAEVRAKGAAVEALRADLSSVQEIEGLFGAVAESHGGLDLLVNNASTFRRMRLGEVRERDFDECIDSNLKSAFFCCQFAQPLLRPGGQIINLLDPVTHEPPGDHAVYAAAKAGLLSLTLSLAAALAPRIRVNGVAPGPVLLPEHYDAAQRRRTARTTLLGRVGRPEDVARTVAFLATGPDYITGSVLRVDGGAACVSGAFLP